MPDKTTIVMKLRKGIKFHDGSELNAEVVRWNVDRWATHPKFYAKAYSEVIKGAEVVDPYTVKVSLKRPSASTLIVMTRATDPCFSIMSKDAFDKLGEEKVQNQPVGSGAMQFGQWLRDDRLILKKFPNYWQKGVDGQSLPYVDEYVERFIQDPSVALLELRAGSLEMTENVDAKDVAGIKGNPDLVYFEVPWTGSHYFTAAFNYKSDNPAIKSLKVRQAAWHALDRESMAKALGFGIAKPHYYPYWGAGMLGFDEKNPKYEFSEAKAKQLMAEAGFAGGVDLTLSVITRQPELRIGEMVKAMWDKVGIRTTLESMERLAWISKIQAAKGESFFWRQGPNPDSDLARRGLVSGAAANWPLYANPEMDKCMDDGAAEYDPAKRHEIYKRCQKIMYDDAIWGVGYFMPANRAFHKSVKDVKLVWGRTDPKGIWLDK
jgi:ABC-type transport system substrate-binding protein